MIFQKEPYNGTVKEGKYELHYRAKTVQTSFNMADASSMQKVTAAPASQFGSEKYGPEEDASMFTEDDWMLGGCKCPYAAAGLNYDISRGECINSPKGWISGTSPEQCGTVEAKCEEVDVYYFRQNGGTSPDFAAQKGQALTPTSEKNTKRYADQFNTRYKRKHIKAGEFNCLNKYKFALKKWVVCRANNMTGTSPSNLKCEVAKRCPCVSCSVQSRAPCGSGSCSCDNMPQAVKGQAALRCGTA